MAELVPAPMSPTATAPNDPLQRLRGFAAQPAVRRAAPWLAGVGALGLAALAWIIHPLALIAASLLVLWELHRREFRSAARDALLFMPRGG